MIATIMSFFERETDHCPHKTSFHEWKEFLYLIAFVLSLLLLRSFIAWFLQTDVLLQEIHGLKRKVETTAPRPAAVPSQGSAYKTKRFWQRLP